MFMKKYVEYHVLSVFRMNSVVGTYLYASSRRDVAVASRLVARRVVSCLTPVASD